MIVGLLRTSQTSTIWCDDNLERPTQPAGRNTKVAPLQKPQPSYAERLENSLVLGLDFFPSDASFAELSLRNDDRARTTQEAWRLFVEGLKDGRVLHEDAFLQEWPICGRLSLNFIDDPDDRIIVRELAREGADVLLTSDNHILEHKEQLAELGLNVMRPSEWLNAFLDIVRDDEDAVDFLERTLFGIGT